MQSVLISCIIPTWNSSSYINKTIGSVIGQTYPNQEIIVVDDGSSDNTVEIVKDSYPSAHVYCKENGGVSSARNLGITKSKGEWLAFLDGDDTWLPDKNMIQLNFALENQCSIVYSNGYYSRNHKASSLIERGERARKNVVVDGIVTKIFNKSVRSTISFPSTLLVHRRMFEKYGLFDESLRFSEDYEIFLRWFVRNERIGYLSEPLFNYEISNPGSVSRKIIDYTDERLRTWYGLYDKFISSNNPSLYKDFTITRSYTVNNIFGALSRSGNLFHAFRTLFSRKYDLNIGLIKKIRILFSILYNFLLFLCTKLVRLFYS